MSRKAKGAAEETVAAEAPAARAKTKAPEAAAPAGRQPDFVWSGQPVYRCHLGCGDRFERIGDLATVEDHERTAHPTNLRVSQLVGPDGQPVIVKE